MWLKLFMFGFMMCYCYVGPLARVLRATASEHMLSFPLSILITQKNVALSPRLIHMVMHSLICLVCDCMCCYVLFQNNYHYYYLGTGTFIENSSFIPKCSILHFMLDYVDI